MTAAELLVLVLAGVSVLWLPVSRFSLIDLAWFVVGLSVLKLSDVWLPRGDAVGMSSALALGALLLFDARVVLVALVVAEGVALLPTGRGQKWSDALAALTSEVLAAIACSAALVVLGLHPGTRALVQSGHVLQPQEYAALIGVGVLFATLEFGLFQIETAVRDGQPIGPSILGSLSFGGWLIAAQASAGILAALMYRSTGAWGLLVSVVMILVMRQSFILLLDIRQAYDATIDVLIGAMEAQRPGREGVAQVNAEVCTHVGRAIGLHGGDLQRLRYAALLLEIGTDSSSTYEEKPRSSSKIVEGVEFLKDVVPILALCEDPGHKGSVSRVDLVSAYIVVAVATATGSGLQRRFSILRARLSPRASREVDAALSAVLDDSVLPPVGAA